MRGIRMSHQTEEFVCIFTRTPLSASQSQSKPITWNARRNLRVAPKFSILLACQGFPWAFLVRPMLRVSCLKLLEAANFNKKLRKPRFGAFPPLLMDVLSAGLAETEVR